MREIALFCEDSFHEQFVASLLKRISHEKGVAARIRTYSARGGLARMHQELGDWLRDLERDRRFAPDLVVVVADANCLGRSQRQGHFEKIIRKHFPQYEQIICFAIPDPHIERWMLVDPIAFQEVFGRGCTLPAVKCAKDEYKRLLRMEINKSGIDAPLGGVEYAEDVVAAMNLPAAQAAEPSLGVFLKTLNATFNRWANS